MSSVHIHNDDYDAKSWFACKGVPSSKQFDLSSISGFMGLKAEVNPCYKATSLFWIVGFKQFGGCPGERSQMKGSWELSLWIHSCESTGTLVPWRAVRPLRVKVRWCHRGGRQSPHESQLCSCVQCTCRILCNIRPLQAPYAFFSTDF